MEKPRCAERVQGAQRTFSSGSGDPAHGMADTGCTAEGQLAVAFPNSNGPICENLRGMWLPLSYIIEESISGFPLKKFSFTYIH